MQTAIPYMQLRGGSSKGLYFLAGDLPQERDLKDQVLMAAMCGVGPQDKRQIDGLGGADPLTSKVAVVGLSDRDDADIDFEFVQVVVGGGTDRTQNCGNILSGVAPFAIETGLITATDPQTKVRVFMVNSGSICEVVLQTPGAEVIYHGDERIDGVPGSAAPIVCNYLDIAGSACGTLLPTGSPIDVVQGFEVTCIDNGMPVVVLRAADMGISGYESRDELNANEALQAKLNALRLELGPKMNLGDVSEKVVPKMSMIAAPRDGGNICTRTFIPHVCHAAIGVLGAVSVATACIIPHSVAEGIAIVPDGASKTFAVEHPSGALSVNLEMAENTQVAEVTKAGLVRTARLLARGEVLIPSTIWAGHHA